MGIEIFSFFVFAASLVLVGFASGPMIARRVNATDRHHYRGYR